MNFLFVATCSYPFSGLCTMRTDEQHIENVAAHQIADRHVAAPVEPRPDRHRHLRRIGSEDDDGHADQEKLMAKMKAAVFVGPGRIVLAGQTCTSSRASTRWPRA